MFRVNKVGVTAWLRDRFDLDLSEIGAKLRLGRVISLTSDSDELVAEYGRVQTTVAVTGTGTKDIAQVPAGERWTIFAISAYRSGASDRTIDAILIKDESEGGYITLQNYTAAASVLATPDIVNQIKLDELDRIAVNVSGGTTDGDKTIQVWRRKELIA